MSASRTPPRAAICRRILVLLLCLIATPVRAGEIKVAVASNFADAMRSIARRFEATTRHKVVLSFGSTGKHYAQIRNGAPFDAFFAADVRRPERLEKEGSVVPGSRFTYALGRIVLWSPDAAIVDGKGDVLKGGRFRYLAVANPKLAPYGRAAQEVLEARGLWKSLRGRIVRGENIAQTFQFVQSGNADLGFVALSQVKRNGKATKGSHWAVPPELYDPIEQQAVLLRDGEVARAFLSFTRGVEARKILREYGYTVPESRDARAQ